MDVDPCSESVEDGFPSAVETACRIRIPTAGREQKQASRACGEVTTFVLAARAHSVTTLMPTKEPTPSPTLSASLGDTCFRRLDGAVTVRLPVPGSAHLAGSARNLPDHHGLTIRSCPTLSAVTLYPTECAHSWSSCDQCQAAGHRDPQCLDWRAFRSTSKLRRQRQELLITCPRIQPVSTVAGTRLIRHMLQATALKGPVREVSQKRPTTRVNGVSDRGARRTRVSIVLCVRTARHRRNC